jgi:hypothetical protein
MSLPLEFIYVAGVLQLLIASANIFAFRKLQYVKHLQNVPVSIRQIFLVQNAYIMLVQVGFALLYFFFAGDLASGRGLGLALSGFLAVFWGSRTLVQFLYYDREIRRANRFFDILFFLADSYLATVFALAALLPSLTGG